MIVGDLSTDLAAESFISLADANGFLLPEMNAAWSSVSSAVREAALIRASRWLAVTYRFAPLDAAGLVRVGQVAARLAAETLDKPLFAGTATGKQIESTKAGSVEVRYFAPGRADAAGMAWPWLASMLDGLVYRPGLGALVV